MGYYSKSAVSELPPILAATPKQAFSEQEYPCNPPQYRSLYRNPDTIVRRSSVRANIEGLVFIMCVAALVIVAAWLLGVK